MPNSNPFDPALYRDDAVSEETRVINAEIERLLEEAGDPWVRTPAENRDMRARGEGPFPLAPKSERAETITIDGPGGPLVLRVIPAAEPRGVYMHIHGGGWTLGAVDQQDGLLEVIADRTGLTCVSVDYRLAPESPYPAGPDDCEVAACWLAENAEQRFGASLHSVGGESAGGHLSAVTLLRMRDKHGFTGFKAANLVFGCFDLSMTPSQRHFGSRRLILSTRDIQQFRSYFLPEGIDPRAPDISPLYADLKGLPRALFTVGTADALLDDTLFMHARWIAAGNDAELTVFPGGAHGFIAFPGELGQAGIERQIEFLNTV